MNRSVFVVRSSLTLLAATFLVMPARGQQASVTWSDQAELSFVFTGGNASSNTLGVKNTLVGEGGKSKFTLAAGGIRTQSSIRTRTATGTTANFTVSETSVSDVTAENYFARGRYDLSFAERTSWFSSAGWDRNTFSGIASRFTFVSGLGHQWLVSEATKFRTDIGGTYTVQNNVAVGPSDNFAGVRLAWELLHQLTATAGFRSDLTLDENLNNTDDLRGDFTNALTVAMSERLALKTSLQLFFDNQPSFLDVPLFTGGAPSGNTVLAQLNKVDSVFTVALVLSM